ncbi:MAG: aminoacyl-tRNA hydrolase, partial [Candidatus Marinimicrobia bacterium]|nr:aminoacyl-tRNA hydrolase [Candidatus Neomarinimicrobiota bacterium]
MLEINSDITIKTAEIRFDFVRSSGPGGQNVNKVASAVQLRFDIRNSTSIPDEIKPRLIKLAGKRVNSEAVLLIDARTSRSQSQNRAEA